MQQGIVYISVVRFRFFLSFVCYHKKPIISHTSVLKDL